MPQSQIYIYLVKIDKKIKEDDETDAIACAFAFCQIKF